MRTLKKRTESIVYADPKFADKIDSLEIKRCGTCWREWPAGQMIEEDGQDRCPECVEIRTPSFVAHTTAREQEYAAGRILRPQISKVPLKSTFPPTIVTMTDASGNQVSQSHKLNLRRNVASTLILNGRGFTATDSLSYSTGLSDSTAPVTTATQKTLSIIASLVAVPGDHYGLTLGGVSYPNCISVR